MNLYLGVYVYCYLCFFCRIDLFFLESLKFMIFFRYKKMWFFCVLLDSVIILYLDVKSLFKKFVYYLEFFFCYRFSVCNVIGFKLFLGKVFDFYKSNLFGVICKLLVKNSFFLFWEIIFINIDYIGNVGICME